MKKAWGGHGNGGEGVNKGKRETSLIPSTIKDKLKKKMSHDCSNIWVFCIYVHLNLPLLGKSIGNFTILTSESTNRALQKPNAFLFNTNVKIKSWYHRIHCCNRLNIL